jgi:tRNA uridine 5-carbamoylmethylation protein Kti12
MAERFLCSVGANPAVSNYVERLRYKLKINAGEVRQSFVILAKLNSAQLCFRFDNRN